MDHTNALIHESSPYLLQHARNPVDWHPWGSHAFELARQQEKPIFLSVGYSTCYWCHVMERQCFENEKIAALMNDVFINVKVDREERPDVDDLYMTAVQAMTGRGGWPMSVFLTPPGAASPDDPGLKPFFAGTYFPPTPGQGMPSFPEILQSLGNAWQQQRQDVIEQAKKVADVIRNHVSQRESTGELSARLVQDAAQQLMRSYDRTHGGFGGAPKFPQPPNLFFLLRVQQNNPNDQLWQAISHTLNRMARGGMYDQIGGGFHRYSTDAKWLVPHFEKMLYDNGQLVELYAKAHASRPPAEDSGFYRRVVEQTCDYVLREMTDPTGTFWSAQDAEVDASEGANYVWTAEQIRLALGDDRSVSNLAITLYGLDLGTNFKDPHDPDAQPVNVLYLPKPLHQVADEQDLPLADLLARKREIDARLLAVRDQRKQPSTDDKVLTSWNGLMIAGLAAAGRLLDRPDYVQAAAKAARYMLEHMRSPDGGLYRTMRQGQAKIPGFLEDYAFFVRGLIQLHHAQAGEKRWLDAAQELTVVARQLFADPAGGYFDTLAGQADLFVRTRNTYDGAVPSGNSQMIQNLIDLSELAHQPEWLQWAIDDLQSFAGQLQRQGGNMAFMQAALLEVLERAPQRVQQGDHPPVSAPRPRRQAVAVDVEPRELDLASGQAELTVTIQIDPEYHLNANDPGVDDLLGTALDLVGGRGLHMKVDYPPGVRKQYPFADQAIQVYEGTVELHAVISRIGQVPDDAAPRLMLRYQICTDQSCLEPRDVQLPVELENLT